MATPFQIRATSLAVLKQTVMGTELQIPAKLTATTTASPTSAKSQRAQPTSTAMELQIRANAPTPISHSTESLAVTI